MIPTIAYTVVGFFVFAGTFMHLAREEQAEITRRHGSDHRPLTAGDLLYSGVLAFFCALVWPIFLVGWAGLALAARYVNDRPKETP